MINKGYGEFNMTFDITDILQPIFQMVGIITATLISAYVPKLVIAFEKSTAINLTTQQIKVMQGAVDTAVGILRTKLDKRIINIGHIETNGSVVLGEASNVIAAIPDTTRALQMTRDGVARMIVGRLNTQRYIQE